MNGFKGKLLDVLLYPAGLFEKLTDSRAVLYAGIILVGAVDLLLPDTAGMVKQLFAGKPEGSIYFNAVAAVLLIVLLGAIDVIFVSIPLYDFFKYMKKKEEISIVSSEEKGAIVPSIASPVKIMKVYIMSHFIIIPISTIIYFIFLRHVVESSPVWEQNLALVYFMLILIWAAAIITRGINTLFRFNPIFRRLTFLIVFSWNFLFGMVFDMQIMHLLLKIFR